MLSLTRFDLFLILFASYSSAWLPGEDRGIFNQSDINLFDISFSTNITLTRWQPASGKIRGVNLGSLFVVEPWLASREWSNMGCGQYNSEFDCVSALGQGQANVVFQNHWNTWITIDDIRQMQSYGLNTIRIPVGYWMMEEIVYSSEHFPQGGLAYLERICGWASDAGFYIIIDMHGAPGAQVPTNPFTGQFAPTAGFYVSWQYERGRKFLAWLTNIVHTRYNFRNVGMLGIVNEPLQNANQVPGLLSDFYPGAYNAIRDTEAALGITSNNFLHVQPMNEIWGSGNPTQYMSNTYFMAYDDHRYTKWDNSVPVTKPAYISDACHNNRNRENRSPMVVGEFSISPPDNVQWSSDWEPSSDNNKNFYRQWFAAQVLAYETQTNGWVFWSWKSNLGDYRWSYQDAVAAGVIPRNPQDINWGACNGV
ncbi:glycoside hydrolase superfamily [Tricladium varicosporioides]|nr:glycoside hydrolase superfamily [Hymenoscyphus varicosporioides]